MAPSLVSDVLTALIRDHYYYLGYGKQSTRQPQTGYRGGFQNWTPQRRAVIDMLATSDDALEAGGWRC